MEMHELESLVGRVADQQTLISAALLTLAEGHKQFVDEARQAITGLTDAVTGLAEEHRQFVDETKEAIKSLAEAQTRLTEAQQHTEQRLNALIAVVDGLIRRPPVQ